jgi:hypothetical protein
MITSCYTVFTYIAPHTYTHEDKSCTMHIRGVFVLDNQHQIPLQLPLLPYIRTAVDKHLYESKTE